MRANQTYKLLHSKGKPLKKFWKITYRMGENICKRDRQGLSIWSAPKYTISSYNSKKKKKSENGQKTLIDISSKKTYRWPVGIWKNCSTLLIIREMQIKATLTITSHQSQWPSLKSLQITNAEEGVEKKKLSCAVGGNVSWYSHYGKQYGDASEN